MATSFGQDFKNENRLSAAQVDMLDTLSGYERGEIDPATILSVRSLNAFVKRGMVDSQGLTDFGYDVLNAHI